MNQIAWTAILLSLALVPLSAAGAQFERDVFATAAGDLTITFIGHATLMLEWGGKVIHVDPVGQYADFSQLPKADLVLITHEHRDHLDAKALAAVSAQKTTVVVAPVSAPQVPGGMVMRNGETKSVGGIRIEAVPAYNLVHMRAPGAPYHPKGEGNGYILTLGGKRVYVAGDTENIPEMKALKAIDIAFLPMNLPFTMTPEMVADAAVAFKPRLLYPYHFGDTEPAKLVSLLSEAREVEVRIREMR